MRKIGSGVLGGVLLAAAAASPGLAGPGSAGPGHGAAHEIAGPHAAWGGSRPAGPPLAARPRRHGMRAASPAHAHPARHGWAPRGPVLVVAQEVPGPGIAATYAPPVLIEAGCGPLPPARIVYGGAPPYARPLYNRPDPFE